METNHTKAINRLSGPLCVIASAVLFGLMPLMTRTAYAHVWNAFTASGARFFIGGLILTFLLKIKSPSAEPLTKKEYLEVFRM